MLVVGDRPEVLEALCAGACPQAGSQGARTSSPGMPGGADIHHRTDGTQGRKAL
jgi:hypothetical protein